MKQLLKSIHKTYGIVIALPTVPGPVPWIEAQGRFGKYCYLLYNTEDGFIVQTYDKSLLTPADIDSCIRDLYELKSICMMLNSTYERIKSTD